MSDKEKEKIALLTQLISAVEELERMWNDAVEKLGPPR